MKTDFLCVTSHVRVHDTEWGWRSTLISPLKCYFIFSDLCIYTQKKKFSQYLCFLIKSTILHILLSNFLHELYYRNFTFTCSLRDK